MRVDLHVHSLYSKDGCSSIKEILAYAKAKRIGAIAITDHDTVAGSIVARKIASDIIVIPGVEFSWRGAHFLAWGVSENPTSPMHAQKIALLTAVAHPYDYMRHGRPYLFAKAVETFNSSSPPWANWLAQRAARKYNRLMVAGSDAHIAWVVGNAGVEVPDDLSSWEDIIDSILRGKYRVYGKYNSIFYRAEKIGRNLVRKLNL